MNYERGIGKRRINDADISRGNKRDRAIRTVVCSIFFMNIIFLCVTYSFGSIGNEYTGDASGVEQAMVRDAWL